MSSQVQYQCAYCKFFINSYCEDYMEHICFSEKLKNLPTDKNYAIVLSGQHNNVLELVEDPSTTRPAASPTEGSLDDEMLISLVQSKRALWDHRLPVAQRSPAKIRQMWESIAQELEGIIK
ncbi:unnamed protein product [Psylliodes chrysocephalus]|uniref:MADF domain-containing protein n=1 Tax=Psylliodes chrysocephalus TaxID=3402493 RepID=A0A9P0CT24_9CUCU|nr:unnamed protein product [Psylliodes chrysocephala]